MWIRLLVVVGLLGSQTPKQQPTLTFREGGIQGCSVAFTPTGTVTTSGCADGDTVIRTLRDAFREELKQEKPAVRMWATVRTWVL